MDEEAFLCLSYCTADTTDPVRHFCQIEGAVSVSKIQLELKKAVSHVLLGGQFHHHPHKIEARITAVLMSLMQDLELRMNFAENC